MVTWPHVNPLVLIRTLKQSSGETSFEPGRFKMAQERLEVNPPRSQTRHTALGPQAPPCRTVDSGDSAVPEPGAQQPSVNGSAHTIVTPPSCGCTRSRGDRLGASLPGPGGCSPVPGAGGGRRPAGPKRPFPGAMPIPIPTRHPALLPGAGSRPARAVGWGGFTASRATVIIAVLGECSSCISKVSWHPSHAWLLCGEEGTPPTSRRGN